MAVTTTKTTQSSGAFVGKNFDDVRVAVVELMYR